MQTILITGGSSGIGRETVLGAAGKGRRIIFTGRNRERLAETAALAAERAPECELIPMELDLSNPGQIATFADQIHKQIGLLDILVNNAGGFSALRKETAAGFEWTMGVNYIGTLLLTHSLLDMLEASGSGRIVNVSSDAYKFGKIDYDNFDLQKGYQSFKAYAASKRALSLWTLFLSETLADRPIKIVALHPGHVATRIWETADSGRLLDRLVMKVSSRLAATPEAGAVESLNLIEAEYDAIECGSYYRKGRVASWAGGLGQNARRRLIDYTRNRLTNTGLELPKFF